MDWKFRSPVWMMGVLLLAFFLGIRLLNADALWFDEAKTALYTGFPPFEPFSPIDVWQELAQWDPWQSPLYFMVLNLWTQVVGWSDFATRYLSLLTGMLAIAMVYRLGMSIHSRELGFYTVTILVGSSLTIHYLHELRPYAQYILMTALTAWAYWRIITLKTAKPIHYALLFLGLVGLAYTHVLSLLTAFGIGAYHLVFIRKDRKWLMVSGVAILAGASFLPWVGHILRIIGLANDDAARQAVSLFGFEIIDVLLHSFSNGNALFLIGLLLLSLLIRHRSIVFIWFWVVIALTITLILSEIVPAFIHIRYLMSIWTPLALLGGFGILALKQRQISPVIPLTLWLIVGASTAWDTRFFETLPNSHYNIPRASFVEMAEHVGNLSVRDDTFVIHSAIPNEEWMTDDTHNSYFSRIDASILHLERLIPEIAYDANATIYRDVTNATIGNDDIVWVGLLKDVPFTRRRDTFMDALQQTHTHCHTLMDDETLNLNVYARQSNRPQGALFGDNAIQVALWRGLPIDVTTGFDTLITWTWLDDAINRSLYSASFFVNDENNETVYQIDFGIPQVDAPCAVVEIPELPVGEYTFNTRIYNWQTGERMLTVDEDDVTILHRFSVIE